MRLQVVSVIAGRSTRKKSLRRPFFVRNAERIVVCGVCLMFPVFAAGCGGRAAESANAAKSAADAALSTAKAQQLKAEADLNRQNELRKKEANTQQDLDEAVAAKADADSQVETAKARLERALLDVEFTSIKSPISGVISRAQITRGNLVTADLSLLTTVVDMDPIYVYFDMDERTFLDLRRRLREGELDVKEEDEIPLLLGLANEEGFPHEGTLDFVENRVNPETGTLRVRAVFPNPEDQNNRRLLYPGLFARIRLPIGKPRKKLLVTERAIGTDQGQKFLYIVDNKNEVVFRPIKLGILQDGLRVIEEGLAAGESVIIDGLQRVRRGVTVTPKPGEMLEGTGAEQTPSDRPQANKTPEPAKDAE